MNSLLIVRRLRGGFRPFTLRLSDGRSYPIPHREFIAVGRHAVVVMDKAGFPTYIDPLHIVSVDDKPTSRRALPSRN